MPEIRLSCFYLLPLSSRYVNGTVLYQRSGNLCYTSAVEAVEDMHSVDDVVTLLAEK
jgi:hypothetical protein